MPTTTEIRGERAEPRTRRELPAVVSGVMVLSEQELDLISVIEFLKDRRFISVNAYRFLLRKVPTLSGSPKERMLKFALEVLRILGMSFQQFTKCLFIYNFRFAQWAMQMLFPGSGIFLEIGKHRLPNENIRIQLFITLKTHLDSNVIGAKAELLTLKAEIERDKIFNSTGVQQQLALDRYVIFTCLRVQQYANDDHKLRLLDHMKAAIPGDADRTFASALYYCKMARITRNPLHIQQALALSQNCNDQFLWTLVALDIMHVLRENFAEDHNQSHIAEIINQCAFGLGCADDTDVMLARIIYLNVVFTLLGINDRLRVDGNAYVSNDNRICARRILAHNLFTSTDEPRRNMMYCLAMARVHENDCIDHARAFAEDAKRLADERSLFDTDTEKRNIDEYLNFLNHGKGRSSWEVYVKHGDGLGLLNLMRWEKFIPSSIQLTQACQKFGRKSETIKTICKNICKFIKTSAIEIITVWPTYSLENEHEITFVTVCQNKNETPLLQFINIKRWSPDNMNNEHRDINKKVVESNARIDINDMNLMKTAINTYSDSLREKHTNIKVITGSPLRSIGYKAERHETKRENCIVLLVPIKGLIPLQEDPFPKEIGSFKVDVREGTFKFYVGGKPSDIHTNLKMGCAIGPAARDVYGTLGGFVDHPVYGLCALTCAHVVMQESELRHNANIAGLTCVQPNNTEAEFGEVIKTVFRDNGSYRSGLDVALIKINSRAPANGYFPDMEPKTLTKAGFEETDDLKYISGDIWLGHTNMDSRVIKYGASTSLTRGVFGFNGTNVAYRPVCYSSNIVLKNQIEILDITLCGPFAEGGDSGSLVFTVSENKLVALGLLLGGEYGYTVVTPIHDVLEAINCKKMIQFSDYNVSLSDGGIVVEDAEAMDVDM